MKRREMDRRVRPQLFNDPARQTIELVRRIVFTGNQERRQLEPDLGVLLDIDQRVEHGLQVAAAEFTVKFLGEPL